MSEETKQLAKIIQLRADIEKLQNGQVDFGHQIDHSFNRNIHVEALLTRCVDVLGDQMVILTKHPGEK